MTLTCTQRAVLVAIASAPYPPSRKEIGDRVGLSSTASVAHHLRRLTVAGLLRCGPKDAPRTVALAPGVAVSRNGEVARIIPVRRCESCDLALPADHHCESDLHVSMDWRQP